MCLRGWGGVVSVSVILCVFMYFSACVYFLFVCVRVCLSVCVCFMFYVSICTRVFV